ncbi:hypothetical protein [Methylobacterium frigidaeris]|uniref:hypothetical protein n=1 Tax=Methylobacterium frigidaeris TaxID=2038277 RepID=UPI001EDF78D2|nr:hypothetical protein [Methylobacterium frigidaeris]
MFSARGAKPINVEKINADDILVAKQQVEIRPSPALSSAAIFLLDKNALVRVVEKRSIATSGGDQRTWLRIANFTLSAAPPDHASQNPRNSTISGQESREGAAADIAAQAKTAKNVVACFKAGTAGRKFMSFNDMRDCAGVWVSPRALVRCSIDSSCPVLPDTYEGRAAFDAVLQQYGPGVTRDSTLHLDVENLPRLPTAASIKGCEDAERSGDGLRCVSQSIDDGKYSAVVRCFAKPDEASRLGCFAETVNNANFTALMGCMSGGPPTLDKLVSCTPNQKIASDAVGLRQCVQSAATPQMAAKCASEGFAGPQKAFADCAASAASPDDAAKCLDKISPDVAKARGTVGCMADASNEAVGCAADVLSGNAGIVARCIRDEQAPDKRTSCAAAENKDFAKVIDLTRCVKTGDAAACAAKHIGGSGTIFAACLSEAGGKLENCLSKADPALEGPQRTLSCLSGTADAAHAFACAAPHLGGEAVRMADCVASPDRMGATMCLLEGHPEARAAQRAYACISSGSSASNLIANCSEGLLDPKTSQTVACVVRANGSRAQLASCAASAALPPDAARLVGCAASSQGPTSFALCAAGPAMNEEWRIAAECAVQSSGNPIGFAGCTAGRLTLKEITQCFSGKGCFGPNNTIIKAYTNAFNDLTKGPGPNNDAVVFLNRVRDLAGGPNSLINNPGQLKGGPNSMINNPSQIWGGDSSVFNQMAGGKNSEVRKILRAMDPTTWRF